MSGSSLGVVCRHRSDKMRLTRVVLGQYFKRYLDREMYGERRRRHWRPLQGWKEVKPRKWFYDEHRPWTDEAKMANREDQSTPTIYVQPLTETNFFKGDRVRESLPRFIFLRWFTIELPESVLNRIKIYILRL